jgi:hypothetical protein
MSEASDGGWSGDIVKEKKANYTLRKSDIPDHRRWQWKRDNARIRDSKKWAYEHTQNKNK